MIASRVGGNVFAGGTRANVPGPGHSRADRSLSLLLTGEGRVVWKSFADDPADAVWSHLGLERQAQNAQMDRRAWTESKRLREQAAAADHQRKLAFCMATWNAGAPISSSPAEEYLGYARGLSGPFPHALRHHPSAPMDYEGRTAAPALLALVSSPDGRPAGLHVTAIKADGSGKAGNSPRRMFGRTARGAVRLAPSGDVLAVAEGIETALAFAQLFGVPTWAALSTAGLQGFAVPNVVRRLLIAADSDDQGAGLSAARNLAERAQRICTVEIRPAPKGQDWNDALRELAR
jgi:phage/plasmid primase-like uncharacterized protein